jgi:hypothetical protein
MAGGWRHPSGRTWAVAAVYAAVAIWWTWPLSRGLARDVAWDLGDSLLNMWILAWDAEQLRAILGGDLARIPRFFDANIFFPESLTLAYSEHLFAQAVQVFPIYLATRNPILCYNLLFLSTFVLSGVGAYLLVRELTGSWRAAFVAGLLFAFAPYRIPHSAQLQVLSSQWMPFALYGFRRYFATGRRAALAGAAAALVAQNLSCGYYLLFFPPFVGAYALWEITARRLWRSRRLWTDLAVAALAVTALTTPFVLPYVALRRRTGLARTFEEISRFSADVYSYFTAFPLHRVWFATADVYLKPEGELFPGLLPVVLSVLALAAWLVRAARTSHGTTFSAGSTCAGVVLIVFGAACGIVTLAGIYLRRFVLEVGGLTVRVTNLTRPLVYTAAAFVLAVAVSPRARQWARGLGAMPGFWIAALATAWWLSLGPSPRTMGRTLELAAPYALLLDYVPGFDGARVPARMAMIVALMLAILGGYGAALLDRGRAGAAVLGLVALAFLFESHPDPFVINAVAPLTTLATPEPRVYRPDRAPAAWRAMAGTPADAVLLELPIGDSDYDVRATYYSSVHWRRIVNGYSGFFPPHYPALVAALTEIPRHPDLATQALSAIGATHVLVHEGAYLEQDGAAVSAWLSALGASEMFREGRDAIFRLR